MWRAIFARPYTGGAWSGRGVAVAAGLLLLSGGAAAAYLKRREAAAVPQDEARTARDTAGAGATGTKPA